MATLDTAGALHIVTERRHARLGDEGWVTHLTPVVGAAQWTLGAAVLDADGRLHTMRDHYDADGEGIVADHTYYAWETSPDGAWEISDRMGSSSSGSLAAQPDGSVHRCTAREDSGVEHAWSEGGQWRQELLQPAAEWILTCEIRADQAGNLHLLAATESGTLVYGSNTPGAWSFGPGACPEGSTPAGSLDVRSGIVGVLCSTTAGVRYAERASESNCGGETADCWAIDQPPDGTWHSGFALGPDGAPHLLHFQREFDSDTGQFGYRHVHVVRGPDGWVTEPIPAGLVPFFITSIAVDAANIVHVAWMADGLHHAWRDADGTWQAEVLPPPS